MMFSILAMALATLSGAVAPAVAQDAVVQTAPMPIAPTAPSAPILPGVTGTALADVPLLGAAKASPDCGGIPLAGPASCVTAPLGVVGDTAEAYIQHYTGLGWLVAAGDDNRVVLIKRRDGGGCDGIQMIAFYDTTKPDGPDVPGYLGFASIPGDICAAAPAAPQ